MITHFILHGFFRGKWFLFAHYTTTLIIFQLLMEFEFNMMVAWLASQLVGLTKEVADYLLDGKFNREDILYNLYGASSGLLLYACIYFVRALIS